LQTTADQPAAEAIPPPQESDTDLSDLDLALHDWVLRHGGTATVAHALARTHQAVTQGHTCLALEQLPPEPDPAGHSLQDELRNSSLVGAPGSIRPLILDRQHLYLQRYHEHEMHLARRLRAMMAHSPEPVDEHQLAHLFNLNAAQSINWQAVAAFAALRHHFAVISGGPGTGKTYSIVRLLCVLMETALARGESAPHVALAAPTGKAAARMLEAVHAGLTELAASEAVNMPDLLEHMPQQAQTLHRLLGLHGHDNRARFHADNPLPHDVVIVDEASMVDLPLMARLAAAVGDEARLILLGDRYQLASVESGSVLADICTHAGVNHFTAEQRQAAGGLLQNATDTADQPLGDHVITLQTSRRFNAESAIGRLAAAVNEGAVDPARQLLHTGHDDLHYHPRADAAAMQKLMDRQATAHARLLEQAETPEQILAGLNRQCILTAMHAGPAGSHSLNQGITERLAHHFGFDPARLWYHGRPVMIRRNDYRAGLFNGDVGIALSDAGGRIRIWFETADGPRAYLPGSLPAHDTVYAMTIHKSQGSEYETVSVVLPEHDVPILGRALFYTGLTRARRQLHVYADDATLVRTITRRQHRMSRLAERLTQAAAPDS